MFERFKEIGGAVSAVVALLAAGIAVVKAIQNAGHELPPILFSLSVLAVDIFVFGLIGFCFVLAVRERDLEYIRIAAYEVPAAIFTTWLAIETELFSVLFSGAYRSRSEWLIAIGALYWGVIAVLAIWTAAHLARVRKAPTWAPRGRKLCPECAEYPKQAARVCRHCGHRFKPAV